MTAFETLIARIPRDRFWSLPRPQRQDGAFRRTGIEIEFAELSEADAAEIVQTLWGGRIEAPDEHRAVVRETWLGDVTVELDTALKADTQGAIAGQLLDWSRAIVPVEIVTPPLPPFDLPQADRLIAALRAAGARGSRDALLYGFGVHLNPEVAAQTADFIVPAVRAYALVEDWLRAADQPDPSRRLLPFVDPWPRAFARQAAEDGASWSLADLTRVYLDLSPTRNRGLDLLPLLEHLDPEAVRSALPEGQAKGGRPTFHYRLPEARVDEVDWSIAYEWNRWVLVERIAARPALLEQLADAFAAHLSALTTLRTDWAEHVDAALLEARIWEG